MALLTGTQAHKDVVHIRAESPARACTHIRLLAAAKTYTGNKIQVNKTEHKKTYVFGFAAVSKPWDILHQNTIMCQNARNASNATLLFATGQPSQAWHDTVGS